MNSTLITKKESVCCHSFPVGDLQANCTVIKCNETKEAVIFDPGNDSRRLLKYVEKEELKVLKLVYTHAHFDHIGASSTIKLSINCPMALHRDDLPLYKSLDQQANMFGLQLDPREEIDELLAEGVGLDLPEGPLTKWSKTLKIIHTPGHSPGGTCFYSDYFDTPVLVGGDTIFYESIGRTDLIGGNYQQLISAIKEKLFILPEETIVIAGHGPTTSIGHEIKCNPFLK